MKKLLLLFLSIAILLPACRDDDVNDNLSVLQYDGDNVSSPVFEQGTSVAAAFFPASFVASRSGSQIQDFEFFLRDIPARTIVRIESNGPNDVPESILYELDVTTNVQGNSWNRIEFDNSANFIDVPSDGVWLTVEVRHDNDGERSIGCDAGNPVNPNGDWVYSDIDNQWRTLRDRTGNQVNINWNIRANLAN